MATQKPSGNYDSPGHDNEGYVPKNPSSDNPSTPAQGVAASSPNVADRESLGNQEASGESGSQSSLDSKEQAFGSSVASGGLFSGSRGDNAGGRGQKKGIRGRLSKFTRRQVTTVAVVGAIGGGGILGGAILQGPFQVIQFASNLSIHFKGVEDFGNDRTSKVLVYALAGKGGQNGRLGVTGNFAANKWEKRLLNETGMRPVYEEGTRRFVGFEIVDDNKAQTTLGDLDEKSQRKLERSMGKGADIKTAGERHLIGRNLSGPGETVLGSNTRIVDLSGVDFGDRRTWINTITKATGTNKVSSALGARLLKKRAGVTYHVMNKGKMKFDNYIADRLRGKRVTESEQKLAEERAEQIRNGTQSTPGLSSNPDDPETTPGEKETVNRETKSFIDDFKSTGVLKTTGNAAIVVGVLCAAKQFGNGVEDYKYANNVLPMIRMGTQSMSIADQVKSGQDFDLATLGFYSNLLYDPVTHTSAFQAESIRANQGKTGGVPIPKEADLRNGAADKPELFNILDSIPMLGTTCGIVDGFMGLPIIRNVAGAVSDVTSGALDLALKPMGTSTDDLMESALKAASGRSVDPNARGGKLGALADTGEHMAAVDQNISTGGKELTQQENAEIVVYQNYHDKLDRAQMSFSDRYLNPLDQSTVVGSIVNAGPSSPRHAIAMISHPMTSITDNFTQLFSSLNPKVKAAGLYDYGVPAFGFSIAEQKRAGFDYTYENPYENAYKIVEPELDSLNEKYGKCFGMTVTADDSGVHIHSEDKAVNVFKTYNPDSSDYEADCNANLNTDDKFNHYRFYLADALTAVTLACYEGDKTACSEIGMGEESSGTAEDSSGSPTTDVSGSAQDLAKRIVNSDKVSGDARYMGQIKGVADGKDDCYVNPAILKLLVGMIDKGYSFYITSLNRRCTGVLTASGEASFHYRGKGGSAVDIGIVNGTPSTGGTENDRKFIRDAFEFMPSGSELGQINCRSAINPPRGVDEVNDSCNHIHIGLPLAE